jgi:hypothetical protein
MPSHDEFPLIFTKFLEVEISQNSFKKVKIYFISDVSDKEYKKTIVLLVNYCESFTNVNVRKIRHKVVF